MLSTRWDGLLPTGSAAELVGVKPATIRKWVQRRYLKARGLDERNHPLYHPDDVIAAEKTAQDNSIRATGIDPRTRRHSKMAA